MTSPKWLTPCLYALVLYYILIPNLAYATRYCDCTANYTSSLPNGSHCPNTTVWNSWTLNCTEVANNTVNDTTNGTTNGTTNSTTNGTDNSTAADTTISPALQLYYLSLYNYTAYNSTMYPLNDTCSCNCSKYRVWGDGTNSTSITIDKSVAQSLEGSVKIVNTTTVTTTTTVNNAVTEVVVNTTFTSDVTNSTGLRTRNVANITIVANVTGTDASGRAMAWGECFPDNMDVGLRCHNCLFIPSMANFTVCVDENKDCPYMCSKTVYIYLGIEYYVSSCFNDSLPNLCNATEDCAPELCSTDYCNTWVPLGATQHTINMMLLVTMVTLAL